MPVMPFLIARAPVRKGSMGSLRRKAAVWEAPKVGSPGAWLKRLGPVFLDLGVMDFMVRMCWRETEGQRKRGGRMNRRGAGEGGMSAVDGCYLFT